LQEPLYSRILIFWVSRDRLFGSHGIDRPANISTVPPPNEYMLPYPEELIAQMRQELVQLGFQELKTADQVDEVLGTEQRTTVVAINSVCGCSAGGMRPGVAASLGNETKPDVLVSVFAGQDLEATEKAREYFTGYPPSSPAVALMKGGELVYMLERHQIEGRHPLEIADTLKAAYDEHCSVSTEAPELPAV
jgi:putative YphP/YqiW family bacilliredoxin